MSNLINTIFAYTDEQDNCPYEEWLQSLNDKRAYSKILMQVDRMELGLFGDSQPIGAGLSELRIHYGPGYRVYYGKEGKHIYLLLCGGSKSTQSQDIKRAKLYWQDHQQRQSS